MKKITKLTSAPAAFKAEAKKINELIDASKPLKAGKGIKITETGEDRMVALSDDGDLSSRVEELEAQILNTPFNPIPSETAAEVTFEPGIIINAGANISPTVDGGSTMATLPRPALTITTSGTIYLEATVDAAGTATAIDTQNAAITPTDTATEKYLTLADVTLSGGLVTVDDRPVRESRNLFICNGTAIWD